MSVRKINYVGATFPISSGETVEVVSDLGKHVEVQFSNGETSTVLLTNLKRGRVRSLTIPPSIGVTSKGKQISISDVDYKRFLSKTVESPSGCILWCGAKTRGGYGNFPAWDFGINRNTMVRSHIWSYLYHGGKIGSERFVLHSCDNPACVNPKHLSVGTPQDNSDDCVSKDRQAKGRLKQTHSKGHNLLNEGRVRSVFKLKLGGLSGATISKELNISASQIYRVLSRQIWKWVEVENF